MLAPRGFIQNDVEYGAALEQLNTLLLAYPAPMPLPPAIDHEMNWLAAEMDYYLLQTRPDIIRLH